MTGPALSSAVTSLVACKAQGLNLEGTRPGQSSRRSAGLVAWAPDIAIWEGLGHCLAFGSVSSLWFGRTGERKIMLRSVHGPVHSSDPLFKPTGSGGGGQALAAQGGQAGQAGCEH